MRWFVTGIFYLLLTVAHAQNNIEIEGEFAKGFVLQHSPAVAHLATTHPSSFWFSVYKRTAGQRQWESRYNFPKVGATFFYMDYYNPILGKSFGLIPNYNFYIGNRTKTVSGYFKLGIGPSYHTKPYDKVDNNKNNVISTQLTYGILFQSGINVSLSRQLLFNTGISFAHFSNGSVKKPNKGINIVSVNPGFIYRFNHESISYKYDTSDYVIDKKWHLTLSLATGVSETIKIRAGTYPFYNIQVMADKQLSYKSRIGAGAEYMHSLSLKEEIRHDYFLEEGANPDFKRAAFVVQHELCFDRLRVLKQVGWYFYQPYKEFESIYLRVGLRYDVLNNLFVGWSLKSHYIKAEAGEWSIGYRFF